MKNLDPRFFPYVQFLQKQDEWSPWARRDSEMFKEIRGEDGTVGAVSYWKGNKKVGEGEHELTNIVANELVQSHLRLYDIGHPNLTLTSDLKKPVGKHV